MDKKKKSKSISLKDILEKNIKGSNPLKEREDLKVSLNDLLSLENKDEPIKSSMDNIMNIAHRVSSLECADDKNLENKQVTNGKQLDNKQITNGKQLDNKQITNGKQLDNKQITEKIQLDNKRVTKQITNGKQLDNNWITNESFYTLSGLQRIIIQILYDSCRFTGQATTSPISNIHFQQITKSPYGSIKTTIMRLRAKNVIRIVKSKCGKNGWAIYKLHKDLYGELFQNEQNENRVTNGKQLDNKRVTKQVTKQVTSASSSSSSNIITTTTEPEEDLRSIAEKISATRLEKIGFTKTHLIQILQSNKFKNLEVLQESIDHISFYLTTEKAKGITDPLNWVMKRLRVEGFFYCEGFSGWENEALKRYQVYKKKQNEDRSKYLDEIIKNLSSNELKELEKIAKPLAAKELNLDENNIVNDEPVLNMMIRLKIRELATQKFIM